MSGSVNKVILVGNLGQDPVSRSFPDGGKVVDLRLATSESWKDKNTGERRERTEWHRISVQNEGLAGVAERFCRKGSKLYIEGELRTRKWQDRDGKDVWTTEIILQGFAAKLVLLDGPGGRGAGQDGAGGSGGGAGASTGSAQTGSGGGQTGAAGGSGSGAGRPSDPFGGDFDDDVPF